MPIYSHAGGAVLPHWLTIEVTEPDETDSKRVLFHSTIHLNMPKKLPFCFSSAYSDGEILRDPDVLKCLKQSFGPDILHIGHFGLKGGSRG